MKLCYCFSKSLFNFLHVFFVFFFPERPLLSLYIRTLLFQNVIVILQCGWGSGHADRQAGQAQSQAKSQLSLRIIVLVKSLEVKNEFVSQAEMRWSGAAGQLSVTPTPIIRRQTHGEYINIDWFSSVFILFSKHSIKTQSCRLFFVFFLGSVTIKWSWSKDLHNLYPTRIGYCVIDTYVIVCK